MEIDTLHNSTQANYGSYGFITDRSTEDFDSRSRSVCQDSPPKTIPAEKFGTGANRNVYFVATELNTEWIELDSVQPHHIADARKIKRYLTGILNEPIFSYPQFRGLEKDYLRAQIARISSSTHICPQGYFVFDEKENSQRVGDSGLVFNEKVKPMPVNKLIDSAFWVHKKPNIDDNGVTDDNNRTPSAMISNDEDYEDIEMAEDEEHSISYGNSLKESKNELYGNAGDDIAVDGTPAWKGASSSPFNSRYAYATMKSHVWPGAYAVGYKLETDFVYIGWAQKHDYTLYASNLTDKIKIENSIMEHSTEHQDLGRDQEIAYIKKIARERKTMKMLKSKSKKVERKQTDWSNFEE